jgi:hypothetical protein
MGFSKKVVGFVSVNRPGFYGNNFCPDGHVLFNVDGPVDHMVPDWRVIGAIDDVYLYLDSPRERRIASILSHSLQLVRLALHDKKGSPEKKRDEKLLASDIKIWFSGGQRESKVLCRCIKCSQERGGHKKRVVASKITISTLKNMATKRD